MKDTLLTMVQDILSAMDGDEVSTIDETGEAEQVSKTIRSCYYDLISKERLPEHKGVFDLDGAGDVTSPTKLLIPDAVRKVLSIKYNKATVSGAKDYKEVYWCEPEDFLTRTNARNSEATNITKVTVDGITILVRNDKFPEFYTSFDDENIFMDAHDIAYDTTLQGSKTLGYGWMIPVFTLVDSFVPDLDAEQFSLLKNESKAQCFYEMRQMVHQRAERETKRQHIHLQRDAARVGDHSGLSRMPNYGRR